jgi:hypothetical protein
LLLIIWSVWFTIVFASNSCDGLQTLGLMPGAWKFASGNYAFMQTVTERYGTPQALVAALFAGVILWEGVATVLFYRAAFALQKGTRDAAETARLAFAVGLALWGAFAIADEIFIRFDVQAVHWRLFIAQLVSLIYLEVVPDDV